MPLFLHSGDLHMFFHIPKCGGTSVEVALQEHFGWIGLLDRSYYSRPAELRWTRTSPQHVAASDLKRLMPLAAIRSSFAVVRHPVSRVVSAYYHACRYRGLEAGCRLETWFDEVMREADTSPFDFDNHLRPQVDFLLPDTHVFRLEDGLDAVADFVNERFPSDRKMQGIPAEMRTRKHTPEDGFVEVTLSDSFLARVASRYADDFERLGYDPDEVSQRSYWFEPLPAAGPFSKAGAKYLGRRVALRARRWTRNPFMYRVRGKLLGQGWQ